MVEETFEPGMTVSLVARRHGVAPNQLFTWRRLVAQGSLTAAGSGEEVVPASDYRALQNQVRELHRLLGKKTLSQRGPRTRHRVKKTTAAAAVAAEGRFAMKTVAEVIGVSRSNLAERLQERSKKRIGRPPLPDDELVFRIEAIIAELPTYGYRRVHAVLQRPALGAGLKPPNHKRNYRGMKVPGLRLDRHVGGDERRHDGRIAVDERNRRWCSDGFEIGCDNGERVRVAVQESVRPASVEAQHPVPDDLKPDAADLGRLSARRTVIDRRKRQKPPNLRTVVGSPGQTAQLRRIKILA